MTDHFMLADLRGVLESLPLFALFLFIPGYAAGWLLNLLDFRTRALRTQFALAVPFSIGICPIFAWLCLRFLPMTVAAILLAASIVVFALALYCARGKKFGHAGALVAIASVWVIVAVFALIDLQTGQRLYFPSVAYDYSTRAAFTSAITNGGIPPHNPYFFPARPFPLRYHYFWFVLCALVQRLAGTLVSPRQAMIAATVWCGIGLLVLAPLYLRFFSHRNDVALNRRMLIGAGLLAVTGLDILPAIFLEYINRRFLYSVELWNKAVTSWLDSVLWEPHHVAGLIACLTGFLLLWHVRPPASLRARAVHAVVAGVMFASALGLSVYVTFVFAAFLFVWISVSLIRRNTGHAVSIILAGVVTLFAASPYLVDMAAKPVASARGFPLAFTVNPLYIADLFFGLSQTGANWQSNLFNLLALPINYGLEFGFFSLVALVMGKRMWRERRTLREDQLCTFIMAAVAVLICTFVRSNVIDANDLGWRGFLIVQFVLLIWGADMLAEGAFPRAGSWRAAVVLTLALGVAGSAYELVTVRFFGPLSDGTSSRLAYRWLSPDRNLGARTYALREIYEQLKKATPPDAVFQHNPDIDPDDLASGLYSDRQVAAETMDCGVVFGGDPALCADRIGPIDDLFEHPAVVDAAQVDDICSRSAINVLIVKDTDPAWRDRSSWVWQRRPLLENSWARAFDCGAATGLSARAR